MLGAGALPSPQRVRTISAAVSGSGLPREGMAAAGRRKRSSIQSYSSAAREPAARAASSVRAEVLLRARHEIPSGGSSSMCGPVKKPSESRLVDHSPGRYALHVPRGTPPETDPQVLSIASLAAILTLERQR
jgi:hypothetical protein